MSSYEKSSLKKVLFLSLTRASRHLPLLEEKYLSLKFKKPKSFLYSYDDYNGYSSLSHSMEIYDYSNNKNIKRKYEMLEHILKDPYLIEDEIDNMIENIDSIQNEDSKKLELYSQMISYYLKFDKKIQSNILSEMESNSPRVQLLQKICKLTTDEEMVKNEIKRLFSIYTFSLIERRAVYYAFTKCNSSIQNDPRMILELNILAEGRINDGPTVYSNYIDVFYGY